MADPTPSEDGRSGQRIAKLLARAGIASRREIERMIAEGRVALNGTALTTPAMVLPSLAGVTVDGQPVAAPAPARLFLYHKPNGLLVTERDPKGRRTIFDALPDDLPRLMPVGRLDLNTEGLLLLTTDGELKRQLELPATGVERAYRARAYGQVSQAQLEELIEGVEIEGVRYGSINANLERRTGANVWIEMILTEGKNREVRRVLEHLGLRVSRLIRTRYGPFLLGDLAPGEIGEVRQHDVIGFRRDPRRPAAEPPALKPAGRQSRRAAPRPLGEAPVAPEPKRAPPKPRARTDETPSAGTAKPRVRLSPRPANGDAPASKRAPAKPGRPTRHARPADGDAPAKLGRAQRPASNRRRRPGDARPSRPRGK
ncbi:pseudouridine synthase [Sphingomonas sp.]|uniref:pseudouridine synthase n=1 Tax=Sphingomonas sp. TaxID=28214 RepID=UPI001D84BE46|nr:pseudouridine synthase [Sphingomonas sp.]MBX9795580.1 pseudouridine synthase [Sphingomonas sp.]